MISNEEEVEELVGKRGAYLVTTHDSTGRVGSVSRDGDQTDVSV